MLSLKDPDNNITSWTYDGLGREIQQSETGAEKVSRKGDSHEWHQNRSNLLAGISLTGVIATLASIA